MHSAGSRSKVRAEGGQLSDKDIGISARIFDRLVDRAAERCKAVAQSGQKVLRLLRDDVRLGQADDAADGAASVDGGAVVAVRKITAAMPHNAADIISQVQITHRTAVRAALDEA